MIGEASRVFYCRKLLCLLLVSLLHLTARSPAQLPPTTVLDEEPPQVTTYSGEEDEFSSLGSALAGGEDVNGDGIPDLLAGAPGSIGRRPGRAFLILGRTGRPREVELDGGQGIVAIRADPRRADGLGASVGFAGDIDRDGLGDFLIGIPRSGEAAGGAAALIFGAKEFPSGFDLPDDLPRRGLLFLSPDEGSGSAVAGIGDLNGDGFPDFAIGAPLAVGPGGKVGRVSIIFGGPELAAARAQGRRTFDLAALPAGMGLSVDGPAEGSLLGASLAGAGDLDGDGFTDLAVGAPGLARGGAVFILFGRRGLDAAPNLAVPDGDRVVRIETVFAGAALGTALAGGRDATGDGRPDLLIGAPSSQREGRGAAVLLPGDRIRGAATIDVTVHGDTVQFVGARDDQAGSAVALVHDTGVDGVGDILIGAPGASQGRGVAYLIHGGADLGPAVSLEKVRPPQGSILLHRTPEARSGEAVAGLGDRNGDTRGDLAVGAPGPGLRAGAVYEVHVAGPGPPNAAPRDLKCKVLSGRRVSLSWHNSARYRRLEVLRDGTPIATLSGELQIYIDTKPPSSEHSYQVRADGAPELVSPSCRVLLETLPVEELHCRQVPGTTKVRLEWERGDGYPRLAVSVDGTVIQDNLPGNATEFEFDRGPGTFQVAVFDPTNSPQGRRATCEVRVVPLPRNGITGLTCALTVVDGKRAVELKWDHNPAFDEYLIRRDGRRLEDVEANAYVDEEPPSGVLVYEVFGLVDEVHQSLPAKCSVEVPGIAGTTVQGRVAFGDHSRTPIRGGRVRALDTAGATLGEAQPLENGEFKIRVARGQPALVEYEAKIAPLGVEDPLFSHLIRVQAPFREGARVEVEVPVPVLMVAGYRERAARWRNLLEALEERRDENGRRSGAPGFAISGSDGLVQITKAIEAAVGRVQRHLDLHLGAEPKQVDLVAHGFSGLAARAYLHGLSRNERPVRALVLLGTPNLGTKLAGLDALAGAAERGEDFLAAGEQLPAYLKEFNRRFTSLRGAAAHLVAGLGGVNALDSVLGCADHDGRVCRESAQGGIPGAVTHRTSDAHEDLGRSQDSIGLLSRLLRERTATVDLQGGGGWAVAGGGGVQNGSFEQGTVHWAILAAGTSGGLLLHSDTSGSFIIILNTVLPGSIDFLMVAPDGTRINPADLGVDYYSFGDGEGHQVQAYVLEMGQVGDYTALIANQGMAGVPYSLQIFLDSDIKLQALVEPAEIGFGESARVTAALTALGAPLAGAAVEVHVNRPDGGFETVTMRDDGQGGDAAAQDGIHTGALSPAPVAGLYLLTVHASGTRPFPFQRDAREELLVRSPAARFAGPFTSGVTDVEGDGKLEGLWIEGGIEAVESGPYFVSGKLTDLAGNPVASGGVLFSVSVPGAARFRIFFAGADIRASRRDGPYLLKEVELLDGNRGFILCERQTDAHRTGMQFWVRFLDSPSRFVRGDANADGHIDLSDALTILGTLFMADFAVECPDAADANGDRAVDIADAVYLLGALFLNGSPPPAPFPGCGTAPALGCPSFDPCR